MLEELIIYLSPACACGLSYWCVEILHDQVLNGSASISGLCQSHKVGIFLTSLVLASLSLPLFLIKIKNLFENYPQVLIINKYSDNGAIEEQWRRSKGDQGHDPRRGQEAFLPVSESP
jgi:hypothetical protein